MAIILVVATGFVSAADENITVNNYENEIQNVNDSQQSVIKDNYVDYAQETSINKRDSGQIKSAQSTDNYLELNVSVKNNSVTLISDSGNEVAITKSIATVNGVPDVTKLGVDYAYVDENGVYTILGSEIRRVMKLDSYCQQIYGYVPKYTFFRAVGSNVKYVINREKWNVIAKSLNSYHVNQGYETVNTPYAITVNLSGKSRYYCVYYDAQEWINGHQYTCGPTAMSMISQALNCYASERKLAGVYSTSARYGTDESSIIRYSPSVHMKLTNINNTKSSVISALNSGKMIFWHIKGHYMCIISYNNKSDKFLCLNPSGPSHNINAVQWANWTEVRSTDRGLKDNGFMSVSPYWNLTSTDKTHAKYYYYNMGGKYTTPANSEYCNINYNKVNVIVDTPSNVPKKTNQTTLQIKATIKAPSSNNYVVSLYLNNQFIGKPTITGKVASLNYVLPAYTPKNVTINAVFTDSTTRQKYNLSTTFYKFSAGKTYRNYIAIIVNKSVRVDSIQAIKDDNVTFTAHVYDNNGNPVNSGKIVFKLNDNTLKENGEAIKINVVNGLAKLKFIIPAFSAKKYKLTAVYGDDTTRFEGNGVLTINKMESQIINVKLNQSNDKGVLTAKVVDKYLKAVERDTKITVKINGKTIFNKVKVSDGIININLDFSKYKDGVHTITINAGENGIYKFSTTNITFTKGMNPVSQLSTAIYNLKTSINNKKLHITAKIVDKNRAELKDDVKLSVKINGKTVLNKVIIRKGVIDNMIDLSNYASGSYSVNLITGDSTKYKSTSIRTTFSIS